MKPFLKRRKYRIMWILLSIILLIILAGIIFINQPKFGKPAHGDRKERISRSPHYYDGKFQNIHLTPQLTSDKGFIRSIFEFIFRNEKDLRPHQRIPMSKTNLHELDRHRELLIWFGHSSYFIQSAGKRILVDPVFSEAAPVSFLNKAFAGMDEYRAEDIPEIEYLVITHDHWDHLDYKTVRNLKERTQKVICPLGVGAHLEYWGFRRNQILEMDWYENEVPEKGFRVTCLPARHFSGRGLSPNQTLWASFLLQTPTQTIYIGGDSGYDTHYKEIGQQFDIDFAILENGQYDEDWKYIHLLPEKLVQAIQDLAPKRVLTVHHSKYALAKHSWKEPLEKISQAAGKYSFPLITPQPGEPVYLDDSTQVFTKWWESIE